jgi:Adenine deaminase C-terminal domain/Protein of unknown function (DUF1214)
MAIAVNRLLELGGGFVDVQSGVVRGELALTLAGLMSLDSFEQVRHKLESLRATVRHMGSTLSEAIPTTRLPAATGHSIPEKHRSRAGRCTPFCFDQILNHANGNSKQDALYFGYFVDANHQPLDASKLSYELHFANGDLPPTKAFWSLTMYDGKTQLLVRIR